MISQVPSEQVDTVWIALLPEIRKALDSDEGASGDALRLAVYRGDAQMWVVHEGNDIQAAVAFYVLENDGGRTLFIDLLAGKDMDSWVGDVEKLLRECRESVGASSIRASCRPGLAKRLMDRGWKRKSVVMETK